jgi:acyl carrier protein
MQNFIKKLEEVFEMQTGTINSQDIFREYKEWDSMALLSLMAMLEDEYNITIPREDFQKISTIEDLFNFLNKNQDGNN